MTIDIGKTELSRRGFMVGTAGFTFGMASGLPTWAQSKGPAAMRSP